ncbi:MAG TPA: hypothetical protein VE914_13230 [Candidatus Angelobacter sp.]|nr:hypothetical protein [Candidatus Angelobacter sp.]
MATAPAGPARLVYRSFRTRSADADWDFFPFGHWGPGYRLNEAQRHRMQHAAWVITALAAQFLVGAAVIAAIGHIDYNNFWNAVLLLLASATPVSLLVTVRWLCVWRLPPAERPLTLHEVQAFRALAYGRDKVLATVVVSTTAAVVLFLMDGYAATLEAMTEGVRTSWFLVLFQGSFIVGSALCAWRAYGVLRLQPPADVDPKVKVFD